MGLRSASGESISQAHEAGPNQQRYVRRAQRSSEFRPRRRVAGIGQRSRLRSPARGAGRDTPRLLTGARATRSRRRDSNAAASRPVRRATLRTTAHPHDGRAHLRNRPRCSAHRDKLRLRRSTALHSASPHWRSLGGARGVLSESEARSIGTLSKRSAVAGKAGGAMALPSSGPRRKLTAAASAPVSTASGRGLWRARSSM